LKRITLSEVSGGFEAVLDEVNRTPIVICDDGRELAVMLSIADYDRLRTGAVAAFLELRNEVSREAAENGLTEERLNELLDDD
jgi:prevent-host-death family protein